MNGSSTLNEAVKEIKELLNQGFSEDDVALCVFQGIPFKVRLALVKRVKRDQDEKSRQSEETT